MADPKPPTSGAVRGFGWEPGTMRKAALVGGALAALLGAGAWFLTEPSAKGPLAPYARLGVPAGAVALQRDLGASFPLGSPVSPLLQRLQALGLRCTPPANGPASWLCNARLQDRGHDQIHVQVVFGSTNDRLMSLDVGFSRLSSP